MTTGICFWVCSLLNDTVSNSGYIVSNECMTVNNELEGDGRNCLGLIENITLVSAWSDSNCTTKFNQEIFVNKTSLMQFFRYLLYPSQPYMFRMLRPSILRSTVMYRREGTVYVRMWCVVWGRAGFIYKNWYMMHRTMKIKFNQESWSQDSNQATIKHKNEAWPLQTTCCEQHT